MKLEFMRDLSKRIAKDCADAHLDFKPKRWNPAYGQVLVYGYERLLGFSGSATLEGEVERAHRTGKCVETAAYKCLLALSLFGC